MPKKMFNIAGVLTALLCMGCWASKRDQSILLSRVDELQRIIFEQQSFIKELRHEVSDGLSRALCTPEVGQLLEDVKQECDTTSAAQGAVCTTKQIRPAVLGNDPERRGRFLKMMSHIHHEVIYLGADNDEIVPEREQRLGRVARSALLANTIFIVVSSPESGEKEAIRRAELITKKLRQYKIPGFKIWRWIYSFPANRADIEHQLDLPGFGEPRELHRGVWVFRADC